MQHRQGADEYPFPPVLAAHSRGSFIGADHRAGDHHLLDRRRRDQQRLPCAGQDVADRALADREAKEFVHQRGQPFHADGVRVVQVDHQGGDGLAEG